MRSLVQFQEPIISIALHVFGDASGVGVAAAAFTVVTQPFGVTQGIVAAKARLPKQGLTIPCLELVAGHMAANLATNVKEVLKGHPVDQGYCWLDRNLGLEGMVTTSSLCTKGAQDSTEVIDNMETHAH